MGPPRWQALPPAEIAQILGTGPGTGLSPAEAGRRLEEHGPNALKKEKPPSPLKIFISQFRDFMILVLVAAAVISGIIGDATDTAVICAILLINASVGFYQEMKAQKAMKALRAMDVAEALVIRDGQPVKIPASGIVPGDVVVLQAGQVVPADLRLIETKGLKTNEAALTGESAPSEKNAEAVLPAAGQVQEMANMAFKGTVAASGRGKGIAVATGMDTELGRIAGLVGEKEEKTPLQKRLADFGRKLSYVILLISLAVLVSGLLRGEPVMDMLLTAISLAVAAIPEGLPAVVAVSLAIGANRMVKANVLVRRLSAVETLGSVDFICTDKTGTLTESRMSVSETYFEGKMSKRPWQAEGGLRPLFMAMALNNDAGRKESLESDPTEAALLEAAVSSGLDLEKTERDYPRIAEIPFDAERKLMSTFHPWPDGGFVMFTKGALEEVLKITDGAPSKEIRDAGEKAASEGLRVMAFAFKRLGSLPDDLSSEEKGGLRFLGLAGLVDPPRPEVPAAIRDCTAAGITTVMITGDHPATAARIAQEIGISGEDGVLTGTQMSGLPEKELRHVVEHVRVYARIAPEQKYAIVTALKDQGHFVAMTGDGVNDAPALKKADIGVAMGQRGTEVAREASDMVLLDDNFASIAGAVREGRRIYDNIRKFIKYMLISNSGELWTIFLAPFFGLPIPLLPVQILWINMVTDSLPAISLAFEPEESAVMRRPPRRPEEGIFAGGMAFSIFWIGLLVGTVCIAVQAWSFSVGPRWQTMVFNVLCLSQLWNALAMRSEKVSLFRLAPFGNRPLLLSLAAAFALQLAVVYHPVLNSLFKTTPLSLSEFALTAAASLIPFIAIEIEKGLKK